MLGVGLGLKHYMKDIGISPTSEIRPLTLSLGIRSLKHAYAHNISQDCYLVRRRR